MFSQNFITLSTRGSIHLNTLHPEGVSQEENNINYIMINAPNIFLGMDDGGEGGLGKPKSYAKEPAILGLKNQYFMDRLLNFLKVNNIPLFFDQTFYISFQIMCWFPI